MFMTLDSVQIQNGICLLLMSLFLVQFLMWYHIINFKTLSNVKVYIGCSGGYRKTIYCKNGTHFISIHLKDHGKLHEGPDKVHFSTGIL